MVIVALMVFAVWTGSWKMVACVEEEIKLMINLSV